MTRRTFAFQQRLTKNTGGSVLEIPHTAVLKYATPDELISIFKNQWGVAPEAVVLPVTNPDGLLFPIEGLSEGLSAYAANLGSSIKDFPDAVLRFADLGLDVYLLIDPTLPFLNSDPLQLIDIVGDSSRQLCIGNTRTQDIVASILGTGVDIAIETTKKTRGKLRGVVIDLANLWPMGGDNSRLELTCFCPSCEAFLENIKPGLVRKFKTFPNPWNLVLQVSDTGIGHINEIRRDDGPDEIVGLSRLKGFHKAFEDNSVPFLLDQAQGALDYIEARHTQVLFAARSIFDQVLSGLDMPPRRILLTEGMYYSWTAGLQLERLDSKSNVDGRDSSFDEVWFDIRSSSLSLTNVEHRAYMCSRGHYFLDAFFHLAANASNAEARASTSIGRIPPARLKEMLRERLAKAMASLMTGQTSLGALQDIKSVESFSQRVGFVGVGLTKEIGEKFIEGLKVAPGLTPSGESTGVSDMESYMRLMIAQGVQRERDNNE